MKRSSLLFLIILTAHILTACGESQDSNELAQLDKDSSPHSTLEQTIISGGIKAPRPDPDPDPTPICPSASIPQCQQYCIAPFPQAPNEDCCEGDVYTSCSMQDRDGDGILTAQDNCPMVANPQQENGDGDAWGDACDNCPSFASDDLSDSDADNIGDVCDDDWDNDGITNDQDNCPHTVNTQDDTDGDGVGDACDNCVHESNPDQADRDEDHRGDVCDWNGDVPTRNDAAMQIGVPYCSADNYTLIDNCINEMAPLPPSIKRGISKGEDFYNHSQYIDYKLPIDDLVHIRPFHYNHTSGYLDPPQAGQTQALPPHRSSHDGRLLLLNNDENSQLAMFRPEINGPQQRIKAGHELDAISSINYYEIPNDIVFNTQSSTHDYAFQPGKTLCEDRDTNPKKCTVANGGSVTEGDCYDISLLAPVKKNSTNILMSTDLTVFVVDSKETSAHIPSHGLKTRVFPRTSGTVINEQLYDFNAGPFPVSESSQIKYTTDCDCTDMQKCRSTSFDTSTEPFGMPTEFTSTSDGKLLFVNGRGISYAYSDGDGCKAEKFTMFKPLSCLPMDPRVAHYPLAQNVREHSPGFKAFTDTQGNIIQPGSIVGGAYPWVDREGRNIFFTEVLNFRDGWKALSQLPEVMNTHGIDLIPDQSNIAKGNGAVALGAWTQGKVVVMDNLMNATDWTGRTADINRPQGGANMHYNFEMALYQTTPEWVRPAPVSLINSPENQLNFLKGHSPTLPFDVVWNFATAHNQNSEVIFDEYMIHNAFVIGHMNSPHTRYNNDPLCGTTNGSITCSYQPDDGFVPSIPDSDMENVVVGYSNDPLPDYQFRRNPKIQNASTSWPERAPFDGGGPKSLRLRGGARIEPVALGGVRGKGIYLDGKNDFIDMGFPKPNHDDWFYGIWLDPRDQSTATRHTVFFWPDESWVALNGDTLYAYDSTTQLTHDVPLGQDLEPGKYFHLGVKIHHQGTTQLLEVYINGTHIDSVTINNGQGFDLNFYDQSWFAVGDPGPGFTRVDEQYRNTWKGWVDEFRIYALDEQSTDHFDEFICNLAMGSLMNQNGQEVCEQLDLDAKGHPVDTPQQNGLTCADKAHQLGTDPSCLRASKLGIAPMDPQLPRPDFQQNHFCNTCHIDNHSMIELDVQNALFGSTTNMPNREDDPRRQPMDWPRHVYGVEMQPSDVTTSQSYNVYDYSVSGTLDYYFHMMPSPEKL